MNEWIKNLINQQKQYLPHRTTLQTDSSRNPSDAIYKPAYEAQLSNRSDTNSCNTIMQSLMFSCI